MSERYESDTQTHPSIIKCIFKNLLFYFFYKGCVVIDRYNQKGIEKKGIEFKSKVLNISMIPLSKCTIIPLEMVYVSDAYRAKCD